MTAPESREMESNRATCVSVAIAGRVENDSKPTGYFGGSTVIVDCTSNFWNLEFLYSVLTAGLMNLTNWRWPSMTPDVVSQASSLIFLNSQVIVVPGVNETCWPTTVYSVRKGTYSAVSIQSFLRKLRISFSRL